MSAPTWRDAPLRGRLLVEASAGTGKTWTMAALYLRLLLDADNEDGRVRLTPERIVVATYTDAAAQELGERLRARIDDALRRARDPADDAVACTDPIVDWLRVRWRDAGTRTRDRERLVLALSQLDRAPIGTLHGLCHRLLLDHPLDGGLGFAPPRLGDGRRVHEALARDLLRRIGAGGLPPQAMALPNAAARFDALVQGIAFVLQPGAVVEAPPTDADLRGTLDAATQATLRALLVKDGHYSHASNAVLNTTKAAVEFLDGVAGPKSLAKLLDPEEIHKERVLPAARAKVLAPDVQAAIRRFETLRERLQSGERAFWAWWAPALRRLREVRSAELDELGFDPLIERVHEAMVRPGSPLPDAAFKRWPVALVDEFQDTDGTQYALLDRWYRSDDGAPRGLLAMVGDPKQAIYGFRGGDVHAYLAAREQADATLRLDVNQRSSTAYVEACNAFFAGPRAVLSSDPAHRIRYTPVQAAGRADAQRLHERGAPVERPLVLHRHPAPMPNAEARPLAIAACAELVVQLLAPGRFTLGPPSAIGARALAPGDIAVLLRTNDEIDALRQALRARGVPCAGQSRQQVFDSPPARDLLLVLHALRHPGDAGALRAALLTSLFGLTPSALPALEADGGLDAWRERFLAWRTRWDTEGVLAAVLAVIDAADATGVAMTERERRVTDLRHLGELLQAREGEGHGAAALLDWLRAQRLGEDDASLEHGERRLRLESDAKRVRLMTLHASKGLEFPVVLLPTLWGAESPPRAAALAPARGDGLREALFESAALDGLAAEQQDERFRLLYVALTRAVQACHVFALPPDRPAQRASPKAKTAPKPKRDPERSALDALMARWPGGLDRVDERDGWPAPDGRASLPWRAEDPAADDLAMIAPASAPIRFALPTRWSFSRLAGGHDRRSVEAAAADDETPRSDGALDDIDTPGVRTPHVPTLDDGARERIDATLAELSDVRGTGFGNALHELLEGLSPSRRFADDLPAVQAALARHAVRSDAQPTTPMPLIAARVAAMLDRALEAPLMPDGRSPPLRLRELPAAKRRAELAFHFALHAASLRALREACAAHGEPALVPPGGVDRLDGWMEGSIDLVVEHAGRVHVLDWKGNALADAAAATPGALAALMDHHHYRFQALLYTVALQRLLRQRLGDAYRSAEHLGAPIYVFLRAVGLAPGLGVWTQRFPEALVDAADAALGGTSRGAAA